MYFLYKKFVPSKLWIHFYINTPYFLYFQIWTFWSHKPKNSNFTNSFLEHYPQPKLNQKSPKDLELILILTMKLLYAYFWKMLPIGDLIWLTPIWLAFSKSSQIVQPTSNHLKSTRGLVARMPFSLLAEPFINKGDFIVESAMLTKLQKSRQGIYPIRTTVARCTWHVLCSSWKDM